jgi:L-ascorbate metabolism protein UlaG (beta-lactamase superfamily)
MEISYLGHSCFKVVGKKISVLLDPYDPELVGRKMSKQDADVVITTHQHRDHNYLGAVKNDDYLLLDSPGEYEIKESEFVGVEAFHDEKEGAERGKVTMFSFNVDGIKIAHLGDLGTELTSSQLDCLDGVDILMIPVGGVKTIDAKTAVKVISQIEPKIVIPMHYGAIPTIPFAPVDDFLHEMGVKPETQDKLKLQKKDLPEELQVVVLNS